jgi:voltage-gated potassium channel
VGLNEKIAAALPRRGAWKDVRFALLHFDVVVARTLDRIAKSPARYATIVITGGILIGGTIFSLIEDGESWPDGIWWAFVSETTVGYGDIAPKNTAMRFLATAVILSGVFGLAILTAALAGRIAERRITRHDYELTPEIGDDLQAAVEQMGACMRDVERLIPLVQDPRVVAALREIHDERNGHA